MAIQKGYDGTVTLAGGAVGNAKSWSLDITQETADTTDFSSTGWKTSTPTLKSWSGSVTVIFDASGTAEQALMTDITSSATTACIFNTGSGTEDEDNYAGTANITSFSITNDVNSIVEVTYTLEGTGALTIS